MHGTKKYLHAIMQSITQATSRMLLLIRWSDWADVRLPFSFIVLLYFHYVYGVLGPVRQVSTKFFLLFLFSICYYGFVFVSNEYYDFEQDVRAGTKPVNRNKKTLLRIAVLFLIGCIVFLSASWNGVSFSNIAVLIVGLTLAYVYSAPPIRCKERGFWGIIVGSLILRPMCSLMLLTAFIQPYEILDAVIFFLWAEIYSMRTMVYHQIDDYDDDVRGGVRTFVTAHGVNTAQKIHANILRPLEALLLVATITIFSLQIKSILLVAVLYLVFRILTRKKHAYTLLGEASPYRPIFGDFVYCILPITLAMLVGDKHTLWFIPLLVIFWQRRFVLELLSTTVSALRMLK